MQGPTKRTSEIIYHPAPDLLNQFTLSTATTSMLAYLCLIGVTISIRGKARLSRSVMINSPVSPVSKITLPQ